MTSHVGEGEPVGTGSTTKKSEKSKGKVELPRSRKVKAASPRKVKSSQDPEASLATSPASRRKTTASPKKGHELPEMSPSSSRTSLPYPTFSKAHSKEAVIPRTFEPEKPPLTPDPTDFSDNRGDTGDDRAQERPLEVESPTKASRGARKSGTRHVKVNSIVTGGPPPSPPLTTMSRPSRRSTPGSKTSSRTTKQTRESKLKKLGKQDFPDPSASQTRKASSGPHSWMGRFSLTGNREGGRSRPVSTESIRDSPGIPKGSMDTPVIHERSWSREAERESSSEVSIETETTMDSDATSLARHRPLDSAKPKFTRTDTKRSASDVESSISTSTSTSAPPQPNLDPTTKSAEVRSQARPSDLPPRGLFSPKPPPPPPAPILPVNIPRVDYLLHHGGLAHGIPRTLHSAKQPSATGYQSLAYPQNTSPRASDQATAEIEKIFQPYHGLLDEYSTVLSKNGSIAVATGYRSVARKLLDRLENVFARDISSETCECIICAANGDVASCQDEEPIGWGEILEWVNGRRETPVWPAFDFGDVSDPFKLSHLSAGLGMPSCDRTSETAPIDADVPEEFREHYIRQSKKIKQTVDRWLTEQPIQPSAPPSEIDDETLTFAILTYLDPADRPTFNSFLKSTPTIPVSGQSDPRAPTPLRSRSDLIIKTSLALQRLYRLPSLPRDSESAIFLLKHPKLHNLLTTLSIINPAEWEVLTSGRFDGFLWSGADDLFTTTTTPNISRQPTPAAGQSALNALRNPNALSTGTDTYRGKSQTGLRTPSNQFERSASRGAVPTVPGPPVPHDEETEMAVLAEVEREIYVGMEALEDAFEALHRKAEAVRQALRERGAGLSMAGQARRRAYGLAEVEVVNGTPGPGPMFHSGTGGDGIRIDCESESEGEWGVGAGLDGASEVWPDDSASNLSSSRHRRPKRRNERRTPAPVEEETEKEG